MKQTHHIAKLLTLSLVISLGLVFALPSSSTHAASIVVNSTNDDEANDGDCTLREAIIAVNDAAASGLAVGECIAGDGNDDTITLPADTIGLTDDLPTVTESLTIEGEGMGETVIDGNGLWNGLATATLINGTGLVFSISDLSFDNMSLFGFGLCAETLTVSSIKVENSGAGAALGSFDGGCFLGEVSVEDSEFTSNGTAAFGGLYIISESDTTNSPQISVSRTKVNNNGSLNNSGGLPSGLFIFMACESGETCFTLDSAVNISDVDVSDNTSDIGAGLKGATSFGPSLLPASYKLDRVTASNNVVTGVLDASDLGPPFAGITISPAAGVNSSNLTVSNNSVTAESDSNSAISGYFSLGLGSTDSDYVNLSNSTIYDNTLLGPNNLDFALTGIGLVLSPDFSNFYPAEVSNTVLSKNTLNGANKSCITNIDLGTGDNDITPVSQGGNLSDDNSCSASFTEPSDQNNVSGLADTLSPLADNGGYVPTMALLEGSPAIDAGIDLTGIVDTDARGIARPLGDTYDSGAYESAFTAPDDKDEKETLAETGDMQWLYTVLGLTLITIAGIGIKRLHAIS